MATWVGYPASYSKGRNRPVQYVVIHATQGSEGPTSAEAGAAYDKRRTDGTSTHLFVDTDTAVREVPDADRAHHARFHGNEIGLGIELCGLAQQTDAQWHDANSLPMLRIAAREVAVICLAHAIPVRRLSVAEVRAAYYAAEGSRPKGICGHVDVTAAYPEDDGSHWDPGTGFPWDEFLAMVEAELTGDDMALDEVVYTSAIMTPKDRTVREILKVTDIRTNTTTNSQMPALKSDVAAVQSDVDVLTAKVDAQGVDLDAANAKLDAIIGILSAGNGSTPGPSVVTGTFTGNVS